MFLLPLVGVAGGAAAGGGAMSMVAAGVAAAGALMEGAAASAQASYEGKVAETNAKIARENAARSRLEAATAEEAQRRAARKALGETAAALAQAGTGTGGSGLDVVRQAATEAELDALNIRYQGETQAGAYLTNAAMYDAERLNAKSRAKSAIIGGALKAGGQLLSGVSDYGASQSLAGVRKAQIAIARPSSSRGVSKRPKR